MRLFKDVTGSWPGQRFKVSWTLTPNETTILNSVNRKYFGNLLNLSDTAAPFC
jgi:hypothetical protein